MKIYTQNNGWCGSIVVIAKNEKQARELMQEAHNYDKNVPVEEHDIKLGFIFYNLGDM